MPPCGTGLSTPHTMIKPPATADATTQDPTTRSRSRAAIGMTPSVIMQIPIGNAAFSASRSARVYLWRVSKNESVMPNGGMIEPTNFTASGP
ncbi:Uncharacterised protein [Klebsiella pneumoniae]|nr:Uncharacterised protein [Klebsiella pneumoniae]